MKSAASVNGIAQETQKKKRIKSPVGVPQELSRKRGRNGKKSSAGRIRRRRKGVRAEGGRLGWEEEAAERNWRRRPRKQMARGRSGERFLGASKSKGREAGHVGRGASLSGLDISRGPGIEWLGSPREKGPTCRGTPRYLDFFSFYFAFWREGPLPISGANLIYYFWWK